MKQEDLILLAMLGAAALVLPKLFGAKPAQAATPPRGTSSSTLQPWVYEVARDNGWVYYSDGTAISPDGKYYKQGDLVYSPEGMYQ